MPKTTISLSETVQGWADTLAKEDGFDNFSAFIADLIRRRKEKYESEQRPSGTPVSYLLNDKGKSIDKNATGGSPANSSPEHTSDTPQGKIPIPEKFEELDAESRKRAAAAGKNRRTSKRRSSGNRPPDSGTKK